MATIDVLVAAPPYINPVISLYMGLEHIQHKDGLFMEELMSMEEAIKHALEIGPLEEEEAKEVMRRLATSLAVPVKNVPLGF